MTTFTWKVDADGLWSDASDWSPAGPPSAGAVVVINTGQFHTVTYAGGAASIARLSMGSHSAFAMTGGSLTISGASTFGDTLALSNGTLDLGAAAMKVAGAFSQGGWAVLSGTGMVTLAGGAVFDTAHATESQTGSGMTLLEKTSSLGDDCSLALDGGRVLDNAGTFNWLSGTITLGHNPHGASAGGGSIENAAMAIFDIQSNGSILSGAGACAVTNAGDFEKSGISGATNIDASFTSSGAVSVEIGKLVLGGGANSLSGVLNGPGELSLAKGVTSLSTLDLAGKITLANSAQVNQGGIVSLTSGTILNQAGASWNLANGILLAKGGSGSFDNAGILTKTAFAPFNHIGADFTNTGTVSIASGTLDFIGAADSFAGIVTGAGTLAFGTPVGASLATLDAGVSLSVTHVSILDQDAVVRLGGNLAYGGSFDERHGALETGAFTLALSGLASFGTSPLSGPLALLTGAGDVTTSKVTEIPGRLTLDGGLDFLNFGTVRQSGLLTLNKATFDNERGAAYDISGNDGIDKGVGGVAVFINAGVLSKTTEPGLIHIGVNVANTGTIDVVSGALAFDGAVTGAGKVDIGAGRADFASTFSEDVSFTSGLAGGLQLAHSVAYTGTISGFSATGTDFLDLLDIAFVKGTTKATYSGTKAGGTLTVTDGVHTANIMLRGNYTQSTFTIAADGHGGTRVIDPADPAGARAEVPGSPHGFIAAAASFGAPDAGPVAPGADARYDPSPALIASRDRTRWS